ADAVARWTICSRSPLTGFWGDANVGGYFGAELKSAGYDGVVITGAAAAPVYVAIHDGEVEIRDAADYWGADVYDTTDRLTGDLRREGGRAGQVLAIGPAGERLVRYAAIANRKRHWAGRAGLGAVWGAKRLKAIYVRGTGSVPIAHPERFSALRAELKALYADDLLIEALRAFGTIASIDLGTMTGDVPYQNWRSGHWNGIDELSSVAYQERIYSGSAGCHRCGVRCKREARVTEGPYAGVDGPGPEYETLAVFGPLCLNSNLEAIAKANELCNRLGLDTMTCGSTIAFALECIENGLLDAAEWPGPTADWGDHEGIVALVEQIGRREGLGDLLAEGSARVAARLGGRAFEFVSTVKGLEAPMHDPRSAHGLGLAYGVSARGACHNASLQYPIEPGGMFVEDVPDLAVELPEQSSVGKAAMNVATQDYGVFFAGCAGFCNLGARPLSAAQAVEMIDSVTGAGYTLEELLTVGRRVWLLTRGLSNLFGARAADDNLPPRLLQALDEGPTAGGSPDMDLMLSEFYKLRGLDERGIPRRDVLEAVGLRDLADLLE
ncbi:MAG TPA: aldehyde ferredoxin oxidoreductase C-terminal domain-containing protein, partial [Thermoleophilia bacterium]|nr:aldehyde ferredoxin oxidoreductase C-terminal domain-containing protein [Thermoleophilia bacterium]